MLIIIKKKEKKKSMLLAIIFKNGRQSYTWLSGLSFDGSFIGYRVKSILSSRKLDLNQSISNTFGTSLREV